MTPVVVRQRVIPFGAWITAGIAFLLGFVLLHFLFIGNPKVGWNLGIISGDGAPPLIRSIFPILFPLLLGAYTLLVGYVYGDARRRGMRYVMWTLLAIFLIDGIGIILYFILRDPLLVYCSKCGAGVQHSHAFCPHCGAGVQPACQACHRILQPGWTHCAWCGSQL